MLKWISFFVVFLLSTHSYADWVQKLDIDIYLNKDRSVNVIETYYFKPEFEIKHGLYRFLPVRYYENANNIYGTPLTINRILVNGEESPYHIKRQQDFEVAEHTSTSQKKAIGFEVIYIGDKNKYLNAGERYSTTIDYSVQNIVLNENGKNRFSWNIQGFGWDMSRDSVTAHFHFPENSNAEDLAFFIGSIRESQLLEETHYSYNKETNVVTLFYKKLREGQDITMDSFFSKDTFSEEASLFVLFFSYKTEFIIWITFFVSFFVWYITWRKVGKDPKGLIRMTRFESPDDMTPAECRYFRFETVDKRTSVATIVDAAIKGYIKIDKTNEATVLSLEKKNTFNESPKALKLAMTVLFGKGTKFNIIRSSSVAKRFALFKDALSLQIFKKHPNQFQQNIGYFMIGMILAIVGCTLSLSTMYGDVARNVFVLSIAPLFFIVLLWYGITFYLEQKENKAKQIFIGAGIGLIVIYIYFIPILMYVSFWTMVGFVSVLFSVVMWRYLMKNRTAYSREAEDKIMGYEHYLRSTEERYLDFLNKPNEAPVLFEKHLPYAIALGCESRWSEAFEKAILEIKDFDYQPTWFHSGLGYAWLSHNLYSEVSTNSVAPASTSGSSSYSGGGFSGGGGSSGGGFGGGGGGGW